MDSAPSPSDWLHFGRHRLAGPHGPLALDGSEGKVPPKALAILWLLANRRGGVVTKSVLLDGVWPDTAVGEDALAFQIRVLRRALADDARAPHYIETVHRVGYRFIAPVTAAPAAVGRAVARPRSSVHGPPLPALVGRADERARLDELLASVADGHRRVVFVTGEAGIGKTALLDSFLAARVEGRLHVGRGQCVEQRGAGEAYLPLLEAVSRLCRAPGGERVLGAVRRHAPSWLAQLPGLVPEGEMLAVQRVARARMLRELADALDVLASEQAVVLALEDLHWGDPSTVEWLAMVARRREPARLLVLGTYRPADLIGTAHPLKAVKHELIAHGQAI